MEPQSVWVQAEMVSVVAIAGRDCYGVGGRAKRGGSGALSPAQAG